MRVRVRVRVTVRVRVRQQPHQRCVRHHCIARCIARSGGGGCGGGGGGGGAEKPQPCAEGEVVSSATYYGLLTTY